MKKLFLAITLLSIAIFNRCSLENQKKDIGLNKNDSLSKTVVDTNYSLGTPEITSIPFPEINLDSIQYASVTNYIGRGEGKSHVEFFDVKSQKSKKYYRLPEIKTLKQIIVDSSLEIFSCPGNKSLDSLLHFKKYQIRFPPIGKFECYYVCDWDWGDTTVYLNSQAIQKYCREFSLYHANWYGFLIVYDPSSMEAKVIELYNSARCWRERRFYIQNDYKIEIVEIEVPLNWRFPLGRIQKRYQLIILENGEINIKPISNYR